MTKLESEIYTKIVKAYDEAIDSLYLDIHKLHMEATIRETELIAYALYTKKGIQAVYYDNLFDEVNRSRRMCYSRDYYIKHKIASNLSAVRSSFISDHSYYLEEYINKPKEKTSSINELIIKELSEQLTTEIKRVIVMINEFDKRKEELSKTH